MSEAYQDILDAYARVTEHHVKGPELIAVHPETLPYLRERFKREMGVGGGYYQVSQAAGLHFGPSLVGDWDVPRGEAQAWDRVVDYRKHYTLRGLQRNWRYN